MAEFKREERYVVVKLKDIDDETQQELRDWLRSWQVPTCECVVVESGWPIYEQTWDAVQRLAEGRPQRVEELEAESVIAFVERTAPRIGPRYPEPLTEEDHPVEYMLWVERERIHAEAEKLRQQAEGGSDE